MCYQIELDIFNGLLHFYYFIVVVVAPEGHLRERYDAHNILNGNDARVHINICTMPPPGQPNIVRGII